MLHYVLTVMQEPDRARACGSGPKSSADRRPIDPPPIVKLNIYEGENIETAKDITFDYAAEFFVFVSLENARPIAHGRVQTPAATSPPVLTGLPVSACCYLDRPEPAGYFLFPDLSVRHEGFYKLIFRLYEKNKEAQDLSPESHRDITAPGAPEEADEFVTHTMEIRSQTFQVFSAKKFPGLCTSTQLSRAVAEQGCRVRIRRDVRMRKRPGKDGKGDHGDDEGRRSPSPSTNYRTRAPSHVSVEPNSYSRRASQLEHAAPPPIAAAAPQPQQSVLRFGPRNSYPAPQGPCSEPNTPARPYHHQGSFHAYPPLVGGPQSPYPPHQEERKPSLPMFPPRDERKPSLASFAPPREERMLPQSSFPTPRDERMLTQPSFHGRDERISLLPSIPSGRCEETPSLPPVSVNGYTSYKYSLPPMIQARGSIGSDTRTESSPTFSPHGSLSPRSSKNLYPTQSNLSAKRSYEEEPSAETGYHPQILDYYRAAGRSASKYSLGTDAAPGSVGQYRVGYSVPMPIDPLLKSPTSACEEIKYAETREPENYARKRHHGAYD